MNKKGFTLIELLVVIAIIGAIFLIATPIVTNVIVSSKEKAYNAQIKLIESSCSNYAGDFEEELTFTNDTTFITLTMLGEQGYIKLPIKNEVTGEYLDESKGCTVVKSNFKFISEFE